MIFRVDWSSSVRLAVVISLLLLGGCATRPIEEAPPPESPPMDEEPAVEAPRSDFAVNQLLNDARRHLSAGNWEAAGVSAERGLRIDRREPELYLVLAKAYVGLSEPQRALEFVRQGLRYTTNEFSPVTVDLKRLQAMLTN